MEVLSLFDGISCGMVAAERAGLKIDNYYAYEIDQNAIKISKKNYPNIVRCGDVITEDFTKYKGGYVNTILEVDLYNNDDELIQNDAFGWNSVIDEDFYYYN